MKTSNIHTRMEKSVKSNQEWNEVKNVTTEIGNLNSPTNPEFVIGSVTRDRYHHIT